MEIALIRLVILCIIFGLFGTNCSLAQSSLNPTESEVKQEERWVGISDTLSMDELLDVAVKFFAVTHIDNEDRLIGQLCVIASGHAVTQPKRDKKIESFCAGVIYTHVEDEKYNMYQEYTDALKKVSTLSLGINKQERLLRAQGALFMLMKMNPKLRELLRMEYEKQKHMLHFYLEEDITQLE